MSTINLPAPISNQLPAPIKSVVDTILPPTSLPGPGGIAVGTTAATAPPGVKAILEMLKKPKVAIDPIKRLAGEKINSRPPSPTPIQVPEGFQLPPSGPTGLTERNPMITELLKRWDGFIKAAPQTVQWGKMARGYPILQKTPQPIDPKTGRRPLMGIWNQANRSKARSK